MSVLSVKRIRGVLAFPALGLALWLVQANAFALDTSISTDPLAAAIMPKPNPLSPYFIPDFILPRARIFEFALPHEMQTPDKYPIPGLVSRTPQNPVYVALLTPPSNSILPPNSMVSLSWLPAVQEISDADAPNKIQYPIHYEIFLTRHDRWSTRILVKAFDSIRQYVYLFSPPGAGRYHWHVRAVYDRAMHGHNSSIRSFMVLP